MRSETETPAGTGVQKEKVVLDKSYSNFASMPTDTDAILAAPISFFNGTKPEPVSTTSIGVLLNSIRSGMYKEKIAWVRAALPDKSEYVRRKKTLPAVTFSCCVKYRGLEINPKNPKSGPVNLVSTTRLIVLDFDHLADNVEITKQKLKNDPMVFACFKSPGGEGLKAILHTKKIETKEDHREFYYAAEKYFHAVHNLKTDPACKDIARLCYLSYDPDLYVNPRPSLFDIAFWIPENVPAAKPMIHPSSPPERSEKWKQKYGRKVLESACHKIRTSQTGEMHVTRLNNAHLVGGFVASQFIGETEALVSLEQAVNNSNTTSPAASMKTIHDGLQHGMLSPIHIEQTFKAPPFSPNNTEKWPEPEHLSDGLKPVEAFSYELLPDRIRPWVEDISDRMQCPPDFPGTGAMIVLAALIGRKIGIYPKLHDTWLVIVNLWGLFVGRPSEMKTPVLSEITKPLKKLEVEAKKLFEDAEKEYSAAMRRVKLQEEIVMAEAKKALKSGQSPAAVDKLFVNLDNSIGEIPTRRRYIINDATVEKLGVLLNENPTGLLLIRDEISGWLKTINRGDRPNDRAFYLEAWEGSGRYTYDRISRGTIDIESLCLSIIGGIQPGKLATIARAAVVGGSNDDGFIQRFQLTVYPDHKKKLHIVDRKPNKEAQNKAFELMQKIAAMPVPETGEDFPGLHFSPEAQALFYEWLMELENEIRGEDIHPAMESHLAKFRSLIPSLALICHLANSIETEPLIPVSIQATQKAIQWYKYLRSHAERIYGMIIYGHMAGAKNILGKIAKGILSNPFKRRDIQRGCWAGLTEPADIDGALSVLEDYGYIRSVNLKSGPSGGRPSVEYHIHPDFRLKSQ